MKIKLKIQPIYRIIERMNKKSLIIIILIWVIGILISSSKLIIGDMAYFTVGVFLLSLAPYMLFTLFSYWARSNIISIITGILLVSFDAYLHMDIFIWNIDALAGVAFIFSPIIAAGIVVISFVVLTIISTAYCAFKGKETIFDKLKPIFNAKTFILSFVLPLIAIVLWVIFSNYIMMFTIINEYPVYKALQERDVRRFTQIVSDKNFDINQPSRMSGMKPLIEAVSTDNKEMIALLIAKGADVDEVCPKLEMTPLMWAGSTDAPIAAQVLIDNGADINTKDELGRTALHHAIDWRDAKVIKVLLDNGADINAQDNSGATPLQKAIERNNAESVKTILEYKPNLEAKDDNGYTALHWAARYHNKDIVDLLIKEGADTTAKTNNGVTAEELLNRPKK